MCGGRLGIVKEPPPPTITARPPPRTHTASLPHTHTSTHHHRKCHTGSRQYRRSARGRAQGGAPLGGLQPWLPWLASAKIGAGRGGVRGAGCGVWQTGRGTCSWTTSNADCPHTHTRTHAHTPHAHVHATHNNPPREAPARKHKHAVGEGLRRDTWFAAICHFIEGPIITPTFVATSLLCLLPPNSHTPTRATFGVSAATHASLSHRPPWTLPSVSCPGAPPPAVPHGDSSDRHCEQATLCVRHRVTPAHCSSCAPTRVVCAGGARRRCLHHPPPPPPVPQPGDGLLAATLLCTATRVSCCCIAAWRKQPYGATEAR